MKVKLTAIAVLLCAIVTTMLFGTLSGYSMASEHEIGIVPNVQITPTPTPVSITGIGPIGGAIQVGQTLTAGALIPEGATATYQWQKCSSSNGTYANIPGATESAYALLGTDFSYYVRVVATGSNGYSGTLISAYRGPVTAAPITGIGVIDGTAAVGQTLTAGAVTPAGALVTYQWQKCATANGTYVNISGAKTSTYTLSSADYTYYFRVVATGTGGYSGTVSSAYIGPVTKPLTGIGSISGSAQVGQKLTAGQLVPSGATAAYQWQRSLTSGGTYVSIAGATGNTYTLTGSDYNYYIRVSAAGTGNYSGTVMSASRGPITAAQITGIGSIGGTAQVGQVLSAGALTPSGATATYQWQRSLTSGGTYVNIAGATGNAYPLTGSDYNYYFKVVATGTGGYTGTVTSGRSGRVTAAPVTAIGPVGGTAKVGQALTAGDLTPENATVTYQWQKSLTPFGPYVNISGATANAYTVASGDYYYYIRVVATGTGGYSGSITSTYTGPVVR